MKHHRRCASIRVPSITYEKPHEMVAKRVGSSIAAASTWKRGGRLNIYADGEQAPPLLDGENRTR